MKYKKTLGIISNSKKLYTFLGLLILLFIVTYIYTMYANYNRFYNNEDALDKLSDHLSSFVYSYVLAFGQEDLTKLEEIKKMEDWLSKTFVLSDNQKNILSYGYEVKYFEKQNLYLFCLYGGDKKRSESNVNTIEEIKKEGELIIEKPSFLDYCINFTDYDIILFAYYKKGNCYKRRSSYRFYKNLLAVNSTEINLMEDYLKKFEQQLRIKNDTFRNNDTLKTVYFKFKNKKIELLCEGDFKNEKRIQLGVKLQKYFDSIDLHDIDYGVFPIYIHEPNVEL